MTAEKRERYIFQPNGWLNIIENPLKGIGTILGNKNKRSINIKPIVNTAISV